MNKRELAKSIAVHADVNLKTVTAVLEGFTEVVTAVVSQGEPVAISGFAKFVKVNRPARMGRNPATGEAIKIKPSKKARITPVKAFKEAVMNPAQAPHLKRGVYPISEELVRKAGAKAVAAAAPARKAAPAKRRATKAAPARRKATRAAAPKRRVTKAAPKRRVTKAAPARRKATSKATSRRTVTARKAAPKRKTVARRPAVKKTTARRAAPKKATTRRPAAKRRATRR